MELIILLIIAMLFLLSSIRISSEGERIVIFRFGRYFRIAGPGMVLILPVIDRTIRVKLKDKIPGWKELTEELLELEVKRMHEIILSK